ncbi:hypothetical protein TTHERM_001005169 (macronuclear) [Tetrahymena thermophila SB210]|uniref:Kinase domain protein n=1 Tax=Tetrahymena thermophila (strain SB210) TaxID=312017 RepID=W7XJR2_TETTS|nr:hypothetical protein TTHERM_001005169 [Tetrahymena thermophila SB210]EWS75841.1 hypothetical protein TTHERM_001005169 [Tetrahymena thermophila SB210]|eukprot:XP_012651624.1 hypothetical protein TTHERM_001005169 [Tetrahymena thermophila SB210]
MSHSHSHSHKHGDQECHEHQIQDGIHICVHNIEPLINLQSNQLLEKYVGEKWKNAVTLRLYLYAERIGSKGCQPLVDSLSQNYQLQDLLIDLRQIINIKQILKLLDYIINSNNNIGSEGCIALGVGLSHIVNLKKLSLNLFKNNILDDGFISLLNSLSEAPKLIDFELYMTSNQIKLAYTLHKLKMVLQKFKQQIKVNLSMSFNQISEKDQKQIRNFFIRNTRNSYISILNIKF